MFQVRSVRIDKLWLFADGSLSQSCGEVVKGDILIVLQEYDRRRTDLAAKVRVLAAGTVCFMFTVDITKNTKEVGL